MRHTVAVTDIPAKALGLTLAALILIAALLANAPVNAAGDDDSGSAGKEGNPDFVAGEAAIKAQDYAQAIAHMNKVVAAEPRNADALNYLGYSHRKLGDFEASKTFYGKALEVDPEHLGANEYLGELYLQMDDVAKAEAQLAKLDRLCFFGCEEYRELQRAIDDHKAGVEPTEAKW